MRVCVQVRVCVVCVCVCVCARARVCGQEGPRERATDAEVGAFPGTAGWLPEGLGGGCGASPDGHFLGLPQHGGIHLLQLEPKVLAHHLREGQGWRGRAGWAQRAAQGVAGRAGAAPCRGAFSAPILQPGWLTLADTVGPSSQSACASPLHPPACWPQPRNLRARPLPQPSPCRPSAPQCPAGWPCGCRQTRAPSPRTP